MSRDLNKINEWKKTNVQRIVIEIKKDDPALQQMQDAIDAGLAPSRQALIQQAIKLWLDRYL